MTPNQLIHYESQPTPPDLHKYALIYNLTQQTTPPLQDALTIIMTVLVLQLYFIQFSFCLPSPSLLYFYACTLK